jgi:zinc protease
VNGPHKTGTPIASLLSRAASAVFAFAALMIVSGAATDAEAIDVQRVVSPGGIEAWLVEDHTNPIIAVSIAFRGGAALDPAGKEGLANMVSGLLDEGAGDLDSQTFQGRIEDLAITLSFDAGLDSFSGTLRTLTANRDEAFRLFALALTKARFDEEPVERIRSQIVTRLKRQSEDPEHVAGRQLLHAMFPTHVYGRPVEGTPDSVARIKIADLRYFALTRLARDNLVVSAVGDITPADLAMLIDRTFGALPAKAMPAEVPDVAPADGPRTIVIDKDVPQSAIRFALPGIKRDDPAFFPAYVMNYVLGGGGFSSRLYDEVREKRGLAYSTYTYLSPFDHAGLVIGGAGTVNAHAGEALNIIKGQLRRMAESGISANELDDAKTYLTGSFPLRFRSSGQIAAMMTGLQLENLGIDYWNRRNGMVEAVTRDEANAAAKRLLDLDHLTVVVVGKPVGITPTTN